MRFWWGGGKLESIEDPDGLRRKRVEQLMVLHKSLKHLNIDEHKNVELLRSARTLERMNFRYVPKKQLDVLESQILLHLPEHVKLWNFYKSRYANPYENSILYRKYGRYAPASKLSEFANYVSSLNVYVMKIRLKEDGLQAFVSEELGKASEIGASPDSRYRNESAVFDFMDSVKNVHLLWLSIDANELGFFDRKIVTNMVFDIARISTAHYIGSLSLVDLGKLSYEMSRFETYCKVLAEKHPVLGSSSVSSGVKVEFSLDKYVFNDFTLDSALNDLHSLFSKAEGLPLDAEGKHFVEETGSVYVPDAVAAYEIVVSVGKPQEVSEAKGVLLEQLDIMCGKIESLIDSYRASAMLALNQQKEFLVQAAKL